ncbi:MAG: hypothetical protein NUW37_15115 [Planctomycetes bacterium]|nr:hypothetical protein [Planctomycetota bacterium]
MSPIFFTLLASALQKYPFSGRLLLFIAPSLILLIAEGIAEIIDLTKSKAPIVGLAFSAALIFFFLLPTGYHLIVKPRNAEEIKPVMNYLKENRREGDVIYLYYASELAFEYYSGRYGFDPEDCIAGVSSRNDADKYLSDVDELRGNERVWLVFSHLNVGKGGVEENLILSHLETYGTRLDAFQRVGASVYLFDLSDSPE